MTQAPSDPAELTRRVLLVQFKSLGPFLPAIVYLVGLIAGVAAFVRSGRSASS